MLRAVTTGAVRSRSQQLAAASLAHTLARSTSRVATLQLPIRSTSRRTVHIAAVRHAAASSSLPAHSAAWLDRRPVRPSLSHTRNAVKSNVVLMGPPGSGKTTVGRLVAASLGRPFIDIDDDVLEPTWGMSVAAKLQQVGDEKFVEEERQALMQCQAKDSVIALTGSNPLHAAGFEHVAKDGVLVYLDLSPQCILRRCARMKVDRIVGQSGPGGLESVLSYRKSVYENGYDLRIIVAEGEEPHSIAGKVLAALERRAAEGFVSTRANSAEIDAPQQQQQARGSALDFLDVVVQGLAPDRGLFVPRKLLGSHMSFSGGEMARLCSDALPYEELALRVLERFPLGPGDRVSRAALRELLYEGYSSFNTREVLPITPLKYISEGEAAGRTNSTPPPAPGPLHQRMWLMETFHGPTASFKDLSLQLLPRLLRLALEQQRRPIVPSTSAPAPTSTPTPTPTPRVGLLVATSGDTGTAALDGFARQGDMPVMVLYPRDGVSSVQKAQMQTAQGDNILVLGVRGADFDFCQKLIKDVFNDRELNAQFGQIVPGLTLGSANSMNWARLVPQVVYSFRAYTKLVERGEIKVGDPVDFVVPTGNFGNILGALYAKRVLGLPLRHIVCASNSNNVLWDFLSTGIYDRRQRNLTLTVSPSIDILVSSNLERFMHLIGQEEVQEGEQGADTTVKALFEQLEREGHFTVPAHMLQRIQKEVQAGWCNEEQCLDTIRETHQRTGQLIDPHTAVAVHVAHKLLAADPSSARVPVVVASTAHYAKFPNAMCKALGKEYPASSASDLPAMLSHLSTLSPSFSATMHPQLAALAHTPVLHADECDANIDSVIERITQFLRDFQARQQQKK